MYRQTLESQISGCGGGGQPQPQQQQATTADMAMMMMDDRNKLAYIEKYLANEYYIRLMATTTTTTTSSHQIGTHPSQLINQSSPKGKLYVFFLFLNLINYRTKTSLLSLKKAKLKRPATCLLFAELFVGIYFFLLYY